MVAVRLAHDAFGAKNNRAGRFSKDSRRLFESCDGNSRSRRELLERKRGHRALERRIRLRMFFHALFVNEIKLHRRLNEAVDDEPLRARLDEHRMRREFAEVGDGRIEDYDLRLVDADGFLDANGSQWIGLSEIGADHHHRFGLGQVFPVVGRTADTQGMLGGPHEIHVTITSAAVQIVGPECHPHELLEQIEFFIGTASRNQAGNGLRAVLLPDVGEPVDDGMHRFQPRNLHKLVALAQERPLQSSR